ncbi:Putative membrane protein YeiH [Minicystis rosea]|nr:Putative membrane protein YeiH [Minicystis rosea]
MSTAAPASALLHADAIVPPRGHRLGRVLIPLGAALVLLPFVSTGVSLLAGIAVALTVGNPFAERTRKIAHKLLMLSVIGLGAGMDLAVVARVGSQGVLETAASIAACLVLGTLLARVLDVPRDTGWLVSVGTAICGGSAIAAVAPVLKARDHEVSIALATVFVLNGVALFLFPAVGHAVGLDAARFGTWAALAVHDTSSVVGAAMSYGSGAVEIATTLKLTRALWIVPVAMIVGAVRGRGTGTDRQPLPKPWFIAGFLIASALVTALPVLRPAGLVTAAVARRAMVLALFLIGAGLTRDALRKVGARPLLHGVLLWLAMGAGTLAVLLRHTR